MFLFILRKTRSVFCASEMDKCMLTITQCTSTWGQVSCQSKMGEKNNLHYLFEKVTHIFCTFKSNALLY